MNGRIATAGLMAALIFTSAASALASDFEEGAKLYEKECVMCHGSPETTAARNLDMHPLAQPVWAALDHGDNNTATDVLVHAHTIEGERIAVSPPYGPHLRGVYGRIAGTVEGYAYSKEFRAAFEGMEWNESTLNVFITDTQRWVPGITMFYRQRDPEVRRKIILYLKELR
ncbi:MAG: c-type cytochrome [Burkholderiales bacterium]